MFLCLFNLDRSTILLKVASKIRVYWILDGFGEGRQITHIYIHRIINYNFLLRGNFWI